MIPLRTLLKSNNLLFPKYSFKCISSTSTDSNKKYKEVKIPVPWGHMAGKWWGPWDKKPILVLHGWQDNCGSFDPLIPLLPNYGYLALDFPGQGLSSYLPPGELYNPMVYLLKTTLLIECLQWQKVSFMGHSMGAFTSFFYSALFPDRVNFITCMDALHSPISNKGVKQVRKSISNYLKFNKQYLSKSEPPSYNEEDMKKLLHESSGKSIDLDKCEFVMKRNMAPSKKNPGQFYFTRDPRIKTWYSVWSHSDILDFCKNIKCPTFLYLAENSNYNIDFKFTETECIECFKMSNTPIHFHKIPGKHHVHLNEPEKVAKIVVPFLTKYYKEEDHIFENNILTECIVP